MEPNILAYQQKFSEIDAKISRLEAQIEKLRIEREEIKEKAAKEFLSIFGTIPKSRPINKRAGRTIESRFRSSLTRMFNDMKHDHPSLNKESVNQYLNRRCEMLAEKLGLKEIPESIQEYVKELVSKW